MVRSRSNAEPLHDIRADYEIAKQGGRFRRPRTGVSGVGTTGDYHFRSESKWLYSIEYARDLDRNDGVAGMLIDRLIDNVLQETGIRPDPDTGDENLNALIKADWNNWAEDEGQCDLAGELSFAAIERTVLRSTLVDGGMMILPNETGALELMEYHRCRTPKNSKRNIVFGIELDENRRRLMYFFTKDEIDPYKTLNRVSDTVQVPARDEDGNRQVYHVYNPHRVSLTRGVSGFHRCADAVGMHDDIEFANLVRQQISSCFGVIRKKSHAPPNPGRGSNGYGATRTERQGNNYTRTLENISPGMQIESEPGEEITAFSPNIPNPQFFEHVTLILKLITANFGIPLQCVLLDASQTNFSGWRGAIDQARAGWRSLQTHLIRQLHRHVYAWRVRRLLATQPQAQAWASQQGVNPFRVKWQRPSWEYIEPMKDTTADIAKMRGLISSPRRIHARRGDDFDEVIVEVVKDNGNAIRKALTEAAAINQEFNLPPDREITWEKVLFLTNHSGVDIQLGTASSDQQDEQQPQNEPEEEPAHA
jgi:lambda family phage portal protein